MITSTWLVYISHFRQLLHCVNSATYKHRLLVMLALVSILCVLCAFKFGIKDDNVKDDPGSISLIFCQFRCVYYIIKVSFICM